MAVRYGDAWARKWDGLPIDAVKRDWHAQLWRIVDRNPQAFMHGLENLPEFPPNSETFVHMCQQKMPAFAALPQAVSKPDPAFMADVVRRIGAAGNTGPERDLSPAERCARRLEAQVAQGARLTFPQQCQLDAIRKTAGVSDSTDEERERVQDAKHEIQLRVAAYAQTHGLAI